MGGEKRRQSKRKKGRGNSKVTWMVMGDEDRKEDVKEVAWEEGWKCKLGECEGTGEQRLKGDRRT